MSGLTPNTISNTIYTSVLPVTNYDTAPPAITAGFNAGDVWYVTPLGTQADHPNATQQWRFDGVSWVRTPCNCNQNVEGEISCKLSTSLAAFNAAQAGESVQITASEYANLMSIVGANKCGATDALMATNPTQTGGADNNTTQTYDAMGFDGPYFQGSQYLIAFSLKSEVVSANMNFLGLKLKWGDNSFTSVYDYTTIISDTPAQNYTRVYFAVKGSTLSPAIPKFGLFQPDQNNALANSLIGAAAPGGGRFSAPGDAFTLFPNLFESFKPYIQAIMTPTKLC